MEEIEHNTPGAFARQIITPIVNSFLVELKPNIDTLWEWILSTKTEYKEQNKYIGGNACTVLKSITSDALAGKDLSGTILNSANLSYADLRGTNLQKTVMAGASLIGADFYESDIADAKLSDFRISFYCIADFTKLKKYKKSSFRDRDIDRALEDLSRELLEFPVKTRGYQWRIGQPQSDFSLTLDYNVMDVSHLRPIIDRVAKEDWIKTIAVFAGEKQNIPHIELERQRHTRIGQVSQVRYSWI